MLRITSCPTPSPEDDEFCVWASVVFILIGFRLSVVPGKSDSLFAEPAIADSIGNRMTKQAPNPGADRSHIWPPCSTIASREAARPRPRPFVFASGDKG